MSKDYSIQINSRVPRDSELYENIRDGRDAAELKEYALLWGVEEAFAFELDDEQLVFAIGLHSGDVNPVYRDGYKLMAVHNWSPLYHQIVKDRPPVVLGREAIALGLSIVAAGMYTSEHLAWYIGNQTGAISNE